MLRYVSDRFNGGSPGMCVGDRARSARLVLFPRNPICCTDVDGDGSGGCFSAAAGQPHHSITTAILYTAGRLPTINMGRPFF